MVNSGVIKIDRMIRTPGAVAHREFVAFVRRFVTGEMD
jgi:hypothetical protein